MAVLAATVGSSRLLARTGDRRLCLLDPLGAALWDLHASCGEPSVLADAVAAQFGLSPEQAGAEVAQVIAVWRHAGLLDATGIDPVLWQLAANDEPVIIPRPVPLPFGARRVDVAERVVAFGCADTSLSEAINRCLGWSEAAPCRSDAEDQARPAVDHCLELHGNAADWSLVRDGALLGAGTTRDAAIVATVSALTEIGCRPRERLVVIHGAGLVAPNGRSLLLIAPGGSGKTTLTTALDATGYGVLSDDVVPVNLAGDLLGLGLPLCIKRGSVPVLTDLRPELAGVPEIARFGQPIRYLQRRIRAPIGPLAPGLALFTRYEADHPVRIAPLSPEQALQEIVAAESVVRDLTQAKLNRLAEWINRLPAYSLRYPDLDCALAAIGDLVGSTAARSSIDSLAGGHKGCPCTGDRSGSDDANAA